MSQSPSLEAVIGFVARHTGLALDNRREAAEAGIRRAMARAAAAGPANYLERLGRDEDALDDLVAELAVGETYFFREPAQFEFIRREVLPGVRRAGRVPRAWSAGCASGEEAYSLAILFEREGLEAVFELLGTDLCRAGLARARRAVYREWSLRGEGASTARPYLEPVGALYRVVERIRRRVTFRPHNLARDPYPGADGKGMDLILCRNVLIYFDRQTVRRAAQGLFEALAPAGWLITASSDPPLADEAPFEAVTAPEGVFYRRLVPLPTRTHEVPPHASSSPAGEWLEDPLRAGEITPPPPRAESSLPPPSRLVTDEAAEAREALRRGDYERAAELARGFGGDPILAALRVRALAGPDLGNAERACAAAVARHPLSAELAYLHAALLVDLGREAEASEALRRVLYLDGSLAVAHFTLGSVLERLGDAEGARRAYRNAHELAAARPPDEALPLAEDETAGRLAEAAAARLAPENTRPGGRHETRQ